jgi:hypothetical protein
VDYRRHSRSTMAAWLFWPEYQPQVSQNRQLDSYPAGHRDNPGYSEPAWGDLNPTHFAD